MSQALVPVVTTTQPQTKCMKRAALMWNAPAVIGLPGRDKTREATSFYHSSGSGRKRQNLLPPQASSRDQWAEPRRTDKPPRPMCHAPSVRQSRMQPTASSKGNRNCNRFPDRPTKNACTWSLVCWPSRHPPPSTRLGRSLRTIAALRCRKATQCAWRKQGRLPLRRKGRVLYSNDSSVGVGVGDSVNSEYADSGGDGDAARGLLNDSKRSLEEQMSDVGIKRKTVVPHGHIAWLLTLCQSILD